MGASKASAGKSAAAGEAAIAARTVSIYLMGKQLPLTPREGAALLAEEVLRVAPSLILPRNQKWQGTSAA